MPEPLVQQEDFSVADAPSYLIKVNMPCGNKKMEGYLGVDISPEVKPDIVADLNVYPWTWAEKDNEAFQIHSSYFIERVIDLDKFMEECYRILVPMGTLNIMANYYTSISAINKVRLISEFTFQRFNHDWLKQNNKEIKIKCNFENVATRYYYNPDWEPKADVAREWARQHYFNVVKDIEFTLRTIK